MLRKLLLALAVAFVTGPVSAETYFVEVGPGMTFNPSSLTILEGDTVTWNFLEGNHTTTSNATTGLDAWDSGVVAEGGGFSHTFFTPGDHPYYCAVHSSAGGFAMNGTIIVDAITTPEISGFDPHTGPPSGGTTIAITGSNFAPDCTAAFSPFALETTFIDANNLEAVTPAMPEGSYELSVSCATGTNTLAGVDFVVAAAPAAAAIPTASPVMLLALAGVLAAVALVMGRRV
jgi:plastocyanin